MNQDNSTIYLIINALLYVITFIIYLRKKTVITAGKLILLIYACSAIGAIVLYSQPESLGVYKRITLFPFIYLYALFILSLYPLLSIDKTKITSIRPPSNFALNFLILVILIFSLPSAYNVIFHFRDVLSELMASTQYTNFETSDIHTAQRGGIHYFSVLQGLCLFLTPLTLLYYLTLEKKKILIVIGLIVATMLNVLNSASTGARGEIIFDTLVFILLFSFFSKFMNRKTKRITIIFFVLMSIVLLFTFFLITIYKFGYQGDNYLVYTLYSYFSQGFLNFNNYGLDAGGVRFGTRTATLITSLINSSSPSNYAERILAFKDMKLNESNFYTFIGEFTLDYGPYLTIVFFVLFYFVIRKFFRLQGNVPFFKIIPVYFIIKLFATGWQQYSYCNFGGNIQIITLIIVYLYFKNDYLRQSKLSL